MRPVPAFYRINESTATGNGVATRVFGKAQSPLDLAAMTLIKSRTRHE